LSRIHGLWLRSGKLTSIVNESVSLPGFTSIAGSGFFLKHLQYGLVQLPLVQVAANLLADNSPLQLNAY
jgi:hypothetical protein